MKLNSLRWLLAGLLLIVIYTVFAIHTTYVSQQKTREFIRISGTVVPMDVVEDSTKVPDCTSGTVYMIDGTCIAWRRNGIELRVRSSPIGGGSVWLEAVNAVGSHLVLTQKSALSSEQALYHKGVQGELAVYVYPTSSGYMVETRTIDEPYVATLSMCSNLRLGYAGSATTLWATNHPEYLWLWPVRENIELYIATAESKTLDSTKMPLPGGAFVLEGGGAIVTGWNCGGNILGVTSNVPSTLAIPED